MPDDLGLPKTRRSSGVENWYDVCHHRSADLAVASSTCAGLSVPYRSIHKCHALPQGDSGYNFQDFIFILK